MSKLFLFLFGVVAIMVAAFIRQAPPPSPAVLSEQVDRIVIDKSDRQMQVFADGRLLKTYPIALGFAPDGAKERQGDGRTPEGLYSIDRRNPQSRYHLSLGLDYPRAEDRARAAAGGYSPGGDIFIHGQPNSVPPGMMIAGDWTAGCIAVTDAEIQELWDHVPIGTQVEIRP